MEVLIVDDYLINLKVLELILYRLGIPYDTALSGHEAVEKACNNYYKLILLDIRMPDMDGFEVFEKITKYQKDSNIEPSAFVAVSADLAFSDLDDDKFSGFNEIIHKPFSFDEIKAIIRKYTGGPQADKP